MAALTQGLPVFFIPEKFRVTPVWFDVVDDRRGRQSSLGLAADTPRVTLQEELPSFLPLSPVATQHCILPFALALLFMFLAVFPAIRHEPRTTRVLARCLWSSRHTLIIPIKKGPMAFKPRSLIFFLLIIVYLTEACDIKCCFSDI